MRSRTRGLFAGALAAAGAVAVVAGASLAAPGGKAGEAVIYPLEGDAVYPEGIALDRDGDFFVGATSDGTIYQGNVREAETEVFLPGGEDGRTITVGMKTDGENLFVAGGPTGLIWVYDAETGELVEQFDNGEQATFINDVTLTRDGSAYFTDSQAPQLYRLSPDGEGGYEYEVFLSFEGTEFEYTPDFNANGIAASPDGRYLVIVQSGTGELFRVDTRTKAVDQIDLGGETLTNGDGIILQGRTLYVVRNQQELVVPVQLSGDLLSGTVGTGFTDESFQYPTTIAKTGNRILAVNSQFDRRVTNDPELPFNVSSVRIPR